MKCKKEKSRKKLLLSSFFSVKLSYLIRRNRPQKCVVLYWIYYTLSNSVSINFQKKADDQMFHLNKEIEKQKFLNWNSKDY